MIVALNTGVPASARQQQPSRNPIPEPPGISVFDKACAQIAGDWPTWSSRISSGAQRQADITSLLFRCSARTGDQKARAIALDNLRALASAHENRVEFVPPLLEAYQITHERLYAEAARAILDHTLREARGPEGGIASKESLPAEPAPRERGVKQTDAPAGWHGLMISSLARAAQVLDEPRWLVAAEAEAQFIRTNLYDAKHGTVRGTGHPAMGVSAEDYARLVQGLMDLYEASFETDWLRLAVRLQKVQDSLFWNPRNGRYGSTPGQRPVAVEPPVDAIAAMNLLRLAEITRRSQWREQATRILATHSRELATRAEGFPRLLSALDFRLAKPKQIIIAGEAGTADTRALLRLVHERYLPNKILLLADGGAGQRQLAEWLPFVSNVSRRQGRATAYICENYVCKLPTTNPAVVARLLDAK